MARADLTAVTEPKGASLPLAFGGDISICPVDDSTYRLTIDHEGVHLSFPLAATDIAGLRGLTGELVLERLRAVA